jgi:integrase/recombinase XerC
LVVSEPELQDVLVQYHRYLDESGFAQVTIRNYIGDIRHFASWLARARAELLLESTGQDIQDYSSELVTAKARHPSTVNRRLQSIRKFYRYALQAGLVQEDPSSGIKLLPQPKSQAQRGLNQSEIERFLDAVRQGPPRLAKRDYAIVQLMLQTGIRVGELTRLRLSDVLLSKEKGVLKIRGQGAFQDREVPLNASVRRAIGAYLEERPASIDDHLLLSRKGNPLSVRAAQRLINTYAQAAGLERVSAYTLRQTCGQHMLKDTGDLSLVARFMGHKRLETAIKYILPRQEDLTEVAENSSLNIY